MNIIKRLKNIWILSAYTLDPKKIGMGALVRNLPNKKAATIIQPNKTLDDIPTR